MSAAGLPSLATPPVAPSLGRRLPWALAALGLAAVAYGPLLAMFYRQQWQKPHYQYFPFVLAAFSWLLWQRMAEAPPRAPSRESGHWLDGALLAAAAGLLLAAIAIRSPWGACASLILLAAFACRQIARTRPVTNIWGVWIILWLVLPLPFGLDDRLIAALQLTSSRISSVVLDFFGVEHVMEGNTLWLPQRSLFVDEACSGIVSILSITACAVVYAVIKNRTPAHTACLALAGMFWATIINVGRISTIAIVLDRRGIDWSAGTAHEILSLALFLVTFLALLSTDCVIEGCLAPVAAPWREQYADDLRFGARLASAWDALASWGAPTHVGADLTHARATTTLIAAAEPQWGQFHAGAIALLFVPLAALQGALFVQALRVAPGNSAAVKRAAAATVADLPATLAGLERVDFVQENRHHNSEQGMHSRTYVYRGDDGAYVVSLDFPFVSGWHEVSDCYVSAGWKPVERRVVTPSVAADKQSWPFVEATFSKAADGYGAVVFAEFDQYGEPLVPHEGWLGPRDSYFLNRNHYLQDRKTFQVQVWLASPAPIRDGQRRRAEELLLEVRERFRELAVSSADGEGSVDRSDRP